MSLRWVFKLDLCHFLIFSVLAINSSAQVIWDNGATDQLWSSPKNWSGDVLPDGNSNVEIDGAYFVTLDITTAVNSVELTGNARLLIDAGKQLTMTGIKDQALLVDGSLLEIKGILYIDLYLGDGIKNLNSATIDNQGQIIVDLVTGDGIWNEAQITNTACILIDSTQQKGIINNGSAANFTNMDSVKIFRIAEIGFQNLSGATFMNNNNKACLELKHIHGPYAVQNNMSNLTNHGSLRIDVIASTGIYTHGTNGHSENHSRLYISNSSGGSGISNGFGAFTYNKTNGSIFIEETEGGISNSIEGTWINEGSITIENVSTGLMNNSCFMNKDSITIDSALIGIFNNDSTFINTSGGVIVISDIIGVSTPWAIYNFENFENHGELVLSTSHIGIRNHTVGSHFDNYSSLVISDASLYSIWNTNSGSLINQANGIIEIVGTVTAIRNEFINSSLTNYGEIIVDGASGISIHCTESTSLINEMTGMISVTNSTDAPISIVTPSTLDNNGVLDLH